MSQEQQEFTQKDLMQHLLNATQHAATREELIKVEGNLNKTIDKVEVNLNKKIDKVEANLNKKIDKVEANLNNKSDKLDHKIEKVDHKIDRMQWLIVSLIVISFFKDQILGLF